MNKTLVKYPFLTQDVEIYERENGHKIVLAHKEGEMVNVSSWVKTGSINEDDKKSGKRMLFNNVSSWGWRDGSVGKSTRLLF